MQLKKGNQIANFALTVGARSVLALLQFLMRMRKEGILKENDVESFSRFIFATGGNYTIQNIPLRQMPEETMPEQVEEIKKELNGLGIRYHVLPDIQENKLNLQICVYKEDQEKFQFFLENRICEFLQGGQNTAEELKNFTSNRTSIISLPDKMEEIMCQAMKGLNINFAPLPDLNLKDEEKQFLIPNVSVSGFSQAYKIAMEGLVQKGILKSEEVKELQVLTPEQYRQSGAMSTQDYLDAAEPQVKSHTEKYDKNKAAEIEHLEHLIKSEDKFEYGKFIQDERFVRLSIDFETLIENAKQVQNLQKNNPESFFCRIPGTYGADEQVLMLPKNQVFKTANTKKERFIAFVDKTQPPEIIFHGERRSDLYRSGMDLYSNFDRVSDNSKKISSEIKPIGKAMNNKSNKFNNFEQREYEWKSLEAALLSSSKEVSKVTPDIPIKTPIK